MLPPLLSVPSAANLLAETPSKEDFLSSNAFSLLASLDEKGRVVLAAQGTFPLQAEDQHSLIA